MNDTRLPRRRSGDNERPEPRYSASVASRLDGGLDVRLVRGFLGVAVESPDPPPLAPPRRGVYPRAPDQLVVRPLPDDAPPLEDAEPIHPPDCRETVRD